VGPWKGGGAWRDGCEEEEKEKKKVGAAE